MLNVNWVNNLLYTHMKQKIIRIFTLIIGVFLVISLTRSIIDLWQKGSAYDREEQRFAKARLENEQLISQYERIQTPEYVEQEARDKLGLTKEGEIVVVLPQDTALTEKDMNPSIDLTNLPIWQQWIKVLFN